jgi:hypothetical protein
LTAQSTFNKSFSAIGMLALLFVLGTSTIVTGVLLHRRKKNGKTPNNPLHPPAADPGTSTAT